MMVCKTWETSSGMHEEDAVNSFKGFVSPLCGMRDGVVIRAWGLGNILG